MTRTTASRSTALAGNDPLLTPSVAARLIRAHPGWLERDRKREHPRVPFLPYGLRTIRYRLEGPSELIEASGSRRQKVPGC